MQKHGIDVRSSIGVPQFQRVSHWQTARVRFGTDGLAWCILHLSGRQNGNTAERRA